MKKDNGSARPPEQIEWEIEQTRHEMTDTLNQIEQRLSPRNMMDRAVTNVRRSVRDNVSRMIPDTVRDNPMPMALIGAGLGWLLVDSMRGRRHQEYYTSAANEHYGEEWQAGESAYPPASESYDVESGVGYASERGTGYEGTAGVSGYGRAGYGASEYAGKGGNGGGVSAMADNVRERASRAMGQTRRSARRLSSAARHRMSDAGEAMRDQAGYLAEASRRTYYDRPLALGLIALAVGATLGGVLPRTRPEDRWLGDTRDELMGQATEAGRDAMERAQRAASRVAEVAREEGSDAFSRVKDAAKTEASREYREGSAGSGSSTTPTTTPGSGMTH